MDGATITGLDWLIFLQHELLLFAGVCFAIGAVDDLAIDFTWLWLRFTRRINTANVERAQLERRELSGPAAVFVACWQEAAVIEGTLRHMLQAWPQGALRVYVGCYPNDPATLTSALRAAQGDPRLRIVICDRDGPTTKADCLNRLYRALEDDEVRSGVRTRMVLLQDAEDIVDPAGLALLDLAMNGAELVQLPVLPLPQPRSRWVAGHYCDEFAENHGKFLTVRQALGAAVPSAGVGCAIDRVVLRRLARARALDGPFDESSLTEDYQTGLLIAENGGRTRFLRARGDDGRQIATRSCFPHQLSASIRQKSRWMHGIALQGWRNLGWHGGLAERWMRLHDRRSLINAAALLAAYLLVATTGLIALLDLAQLLEPPALPVHLRWLLLANLGFFAWRAVWRAAFTAREYGAVEGMRSFLRIPLANIIAIIAARRALFAYARSLRGDPACWDKTTHDPPVVALKIRQARKGVRA